jgi:hypothetical protein
MLHLILLGTLAAGQIESGMASPDFQDRERATRAAKKFWPLMPRLLARLHHDRATDEEVVYRLKQALPPTAVRLTLVLGDPTGRATFRIVSGPLDTPPRQLAGLTVGGGAAVQEPLTVSHEAGGPRNSLARMWVLCDPRAGFYMNELVKCYDADGMVNTTFVYEINQGSGEATYCPCDHAYVWHMQANARHRPSFPVFGAKGRAWFGWDDEWYYIHAGASIDSLVREYRYSVYGDLNQ